MVKEIVDHFESRGFTWQGVLAFLTGAGIVFGIAIQLGVGSARDDALNLRLTEVERLIRVIEGKQYNGLARQDDHDRRLSVIENHDIKTREIEAHILERLSKVEAK